MTKRQEERRCKRSDDLQKALDYQLEASMQRAGFKALVLADELGLFVAGAGDARCFEKLAAVSPRITGPGRSWRGSLVTRKQRHKLSVAPLTLKQGQTLYLAATQGQNEAISRELFASGRGVLRILS